MAVCKVCHGEHEQIDEHGFCPKCTKAYNDAFYGKPVDVQFKCKKCNRTWSETMNSDDVHVFYETGAFHPKDDNGAYFVLCKNCQ